MANTTELNRRLQLQFQVGTTSKGLPKLKNQNYAHVNPNLSDDDLISVGEALAALFDEPLYQVTRIVQDGVTASSSTSSSASSSSSSSGSSASGTGSSASTTSTTSK